jgi:hypothetical protein
MLDAMENAVGAGISTSIPMVTMRSITVKCLIHLLVQNHPDK